jgi:hypothetical protein
MPTTVEIAPISQITKTEKSRLLAEKPIRNNLLGSLAQALREVADTDEAVFYGALLPESRINNIRTTMARHGMRVSVNRVDRDGVRGLLLTATTIDQPARAEDADL